VSGWISITVRIADRYRTDPDAVGSIPVTAANVTASRWRSSRACRLWTDRRRLLARDPSRLKEVGGAPQRTSHRTKAAPSTRSRSKLAR
jgi:hypothetical protein